LLNKKESAAEDLDSSQFALSMSGWCVMAW